LNYSPIKTLSNLAKIGGKRKSKRAHPQSSSFSHPS